MNGNGHGTWHEGWTSLYEWEFDFFTFLIATNGQEERAAHLAGITLRNVELHRTHNREFKKRWKIVRAVIADNKRRRDRREAQRQRYIQAVRRIAP